MSWTAKRTKDSPLNIGKANKTLEIEKTLNKLKTRLNIHLNK